MIRSSHGTRPTPRRRGFTLIEILVVIIIVAILVGLLLPVIAGAIRTAKNAAVSSEINLLAQALESFKAKYGQYPPSRVFLSENGYYNVANTTLIAPGDITYGQLAQRTLSAFRQMFPKVVFSTSGQVPAFNQNSYWYDFNGNGQYDANGYILSGHECLVFFLGGIPLPNTLPPVAPSTFGLTGFGKDPTNPFSNSISSDTRYNGGPNPMYNTNRQPSFFEFNAGRLYLDPYNVSMTSTGTASNPGIPAYYDSLGVTTPVQGATSLNFYAYFSAYGNGLYDANDVNLPFEADAYLAQPIGLGLQTGGRTYISVSPNPYTATLTVTTTGTVTYQKPQTYQILSAGVDGQYGVGGQYVTATTPGSGSSTNPLPFDSYHTYAGSSLTTDATIRKRENDNLTNFKTSTLD